LTKTGKHVKGTSKINKGMS